MGRGVLFRGRWAEASEAPAAAPRAKARPSVPFVLPGFAVNRWSIQLFNALTYMLMFPDVAMREKCWAAFREDAEWVKLRTTPGYSNADILTGNNVQFLRPTDFSQV